MPPTLRTWRFRSELRRAYVLGLFLFAVGGGVIGQAMLTGFASLGLVSLAAACLVVLAALLLVDFQGPLVLEELRLIVPGREAVAVHRLASARAGSGGVLHLTLQHPAGELEIPTGQPEDAVQAFADALEAAIPR